MRERSSLAAVSSATLEQLREAIVRERIRVPLTEAGLAAIGIREQAAALHGVLAGHNRLACLSILDVVLAEREKQKRPAPELVWTGPEDQSATARDTAVVLRQLFEGARRRVILAGYSFDHGRELLAPLHAAMRDRGAEVIFFVNIKQPEELRDPPEAHAADVLSKFERDNWPFGDPRPRIYYDKRALYPGGSGTGRPYVSLHSKCVVVDDDKAFISSANFTNRGHERNIETGVLLQDPLFAEHLARQWLGLISGGFVAEWKGSST